jgi:hypothetical protein
LLPNNESPVVSQGRKQAQMFFIDIPDELDDFIISPRNILE